MISNKRIAAVLILFSAAFIGINQTNSVEKIQILRPLRMFPNQLGTWKQIDKSFLPPEISDKLGVDDYINYTYIHPNGTTANFYASYFGAVGITGEYHSPKNCVPGGGWRITDRSRMTLDLQHSDSKSFPVNYFSLQNAAKKQIMVYWYQNRGRIINSEYWEKVYLVYDAITKQRRDGAFIRITSIYPDKNNDSFKADLKRFSEMVANELKNFLPGKKL